MKERGKGKKVFLRLRKKKKIKKKIGGKKKKKTACS